MRRAVICLATWFACSEPCLQADTIKVTSPDTAQTFAYGEAIEHQLFWSPKQQSLYAYLTFSNWLYASRDEPRVDQSFVFRLPGVKYDAATKTFFGEDKKGQQVPVAVMRHRLIGSSVVPLPGTILFVLKDHGAIAVILTVDSDTRVSSHWVERDEAWSLENLIRRTVGATRSPAVPAGD